MKAKYWVSQVGTTDDFDRPYGTTMYDAKTVFGPWACMSEESYRKSGIGRLGTGLGQKYEKQTDGKWLKVDG